MNSEANVRVEKDLLGERNISLDAYYGINTLRATENFSVTGNSISQYPHFIKALAAVKQAAATTNRELGLLDDQLAAAIARACKSLWSGHYHEQFVVDVIQGGAGTSTNMNANEVIANLALEFLGHQKGEYQYLHPNEHVNLGQSTNDVYPTAIKLALCFSISELQSTMEQLQDAFSSKATEFRDVIKMGRTQLQDAVPMTLGQEFSSYADMIKEDRQRLGEAISLVQEINLGGTAIGTGLNAHPDYAARVCQHLSNVTRLSLSTAPNLIEATQDCGAFVQLSGVLKRVAIKLSKTCNDLRLLSSGPRAGLNEINLPAVQAGSSIMPGKVNPVILELANQVAYEVIGNDTTISFAAESGQLQLNAFEPVIAHSLFKSIGHLKNVCQLLEERCIRGISANEEHLRNQVENSIGLATALTPYIGYHDASELAKQALSKNCTIAEIALQKKLLTKQQLDQILKPETLAKSLSQRLV